MEIPLDCNVTFALSKSRKATVDAEQLAEFVKATWEAGELKVDPADGKEKFNIDLADALTKLKAWVKEQSKVDLSDGEALGIWKLCNVPPNKDGTRNDPWSQKKRSWESPSEMTRSSPASTEPDPRFAED